MAYKRHFKIFNVELEVVMQHVRLIFLIQSNKALFQGRQCLYFLSYCSNWHVELPEYNMAPQSN